MAPNRYSPEFKDEAVRMVIDSSRTIADVAAEVGVSSETLRNWVKSYRREHAGEGPELGESERDELARLRKENREMRQEQEFLGKAAAFFAKKYR